MATMRSDTQGLPAPILNQIICPHCWERSPVDEIVWVSEHAELRGDSKLGRDAPRRFLSSRFTPEGDAIDSKGMVCHQLACPKCHLAIPRALLATEPLFISVLGTPGSGKSYFLASATWKLRETLPHKFGVSFADTDLLTNQMMIQSEEGLFLNAEPDELVWLGGLIRKTEAALANTELYDNVSYGSHDVYYLRPYMFTVRAMGHHPSLERRPLPGRVICLYDNAGEHFLPGQDTAASPVTRHLALSQATLFLYDPTQDPRFRDACQRAGLKPPKVERDRIFRQETTLNEAAARCRQHARLAGRKPVERVLIVVISKYDTWAPLLDVSGSLEPWWSAPSGGVAGLDVDGIEQRSSLLRKLLLQLSPEIVAAADGFASEVVFVPASALGAGAEIDPVTGKLGIRPRNIKPQGVTVPFLYALYRSAPGLILRLKRRG